MKKIIALRGLSHSGKTTSIKAALDRLKTNPSVVVVDIIKDGRDVIIVVKINGMIIVFGSAGDTEAVWNAMRRKIASIDWDVLVCATKSKGKTVEIVEDLARGHSLVWIPTHLVLENVEAANADTTEKILSNIGVG
jgi:hypothetical protein